MTNQKEKRKVPELRFPDFSGEWEVNDFGNIVSNKSNKYLPNKNEDLIDIELDSIESNTGRLLKTYKSSEQKSQKNVFQKKDVLYSKLRPYLNKYYFSDFTGVCSSEIWILNSKNDELLDNIFIYYFIQTIRFSSVANKSAGSKMPRADWGLVENIKFTIPKLDEQQKIGEFFSKLDRQIELEEKKLALLEEQKKGYMQKIFSQELRFKDENGEAYPEWVNTKFDKIFYEVQNKTGETRNYPLHSLTVEKGITQKSARYNREFLVSKEDNYKLVSCNNIIYNPMNITLGAIDISDIPFKITVSGYYTVMSINGNYDPYYIAKFLKTRNMITHYKRIATGSLIEKQRVHFSEFIKINKQIPTLNEQIQIGKFIRILEKNSELTKRKIEKLNKRKSKLLQLMIL